DLAVGAFFEENNLKPVLRRAGEFNVYETSGIEIWCGDFFALPAKATAGVTAGYDRASLVAFPPHAQPAYADKLAQLLPEGSDLFLITLDYDQSQMNGPPFSVPDQQVERLFRPAFEIAKREETEILDAEQRYRERGLTRLTSSVHWLHRRPSGKG
ncbi:MAG TPA: thiopurine S-methyltransferase, partial [Hyphomicrobiaceae bacterium]|nr:thiopurine S-methyltransferase [Hyphomicrobiaceae bacterium]